jgi:hypothetical protein
METRGVAAVTDRNITLEDVLTILGRAGSVTLRKGTNDVSATPGMVMRGQPCWLQ